MAGKRAATTELNHNNWDEDEEREDAGTFKQAPLEVLQMRARKKAKRRIPQNEEESTKNIFSTFAGFSKPPTTTSSFNFLSNTVNNGFSSTSSPSKQTPITTSLSTDKNTEYYSKLAGLNQSFLDWIKVHVEANPLCILTPTFKDYERHIEEINKEKDLKVETSKPPETTSNSLFNPLTTTTSTPFASFPKTDFSFGNAKPFSFANVCSTPKPAEPAEEDDDEEPPKEEFVPVVEEGHVYTIKCKVFLKKGSEFAERGVGQLYLKPVEGSEKTQLIVRAETALGNLLLNLIVSQNIPISKKGKNHVMLVSKPMPEMDPTAILIKVKTAEDADALLNALEKYKK